MINNDVLRTLKKKYRITVKELASISGIPYSSLGKYLCKADDRQIPNDRLELLQIKLEKYFKENPHAEHNNPQR